MGHWSFAIINGKLAEIHFDKMKDGSIKLYGHCYVKASEYKTKQEKKYIEEDTKKNAAIVAEKEIQIYR